MRRFFHGLTATLIALPCLVQAQDRFPTVPPAQYSKAQSQAASGPFVPMMYSPEVMSRARAMGDYLRYKSGIGNMLSELVILVTARDWGQDYEWSVHAPIAAKAGIRPDTIAAIRDGRRPEGMSDDENIVYEFSTELLHNKSVSDSTFAVAEKRFGKPAVIDLVGLVGYYTFNAMLLNTARFKPQNGPALPRFPD